MRIAVITGWFSSILLSLILPISAAAGAQGTATAHPLFSSPHASPIAVSGDRVFVVNTPADTVDVIDAATRTVVARVTVGVDPVGIAVRPDGLEVWVSNHVSDSVSVIDADPSSPTHLQVVATVQDIDPFSKATRFDEPVGIAFAGNDKAYVALSSENQIAVVDVSDRRIDRRLTITAQDPRAIAVAGDRLFVIPFESNNRTQISGCVGPLIGDCTFDATEHVVTNNNVLSLGIDVDIVKNSRIPDRDLFVFDTATDQPVQVVDGLGTLLYGIAVDSAGRVYVAQTDARNDANGQAGTLGHGLAEMENRAFLNRITRIDCSGASCATPEFFELEPLPPSHPAAGQALATPFAIQISGDDSTLVVSAAGSDKLFTVDALSGAVLGRVEVDPVPRGIALESTESGQPSRAWVLNAVANTVSVVDLSDPSSPGIVATVVLEDPTHPALKRGRIAFHDADASTTGTFSCDSCHPDGHTDQLVWVLDTPICDLGGCTQIPPRTTMPVRGLRDTAPYHWDGIPGDPYGGRNTANVFGFVAPNCTLDAPESCTRNLVDGALATTMCQVGQCPENDEGQPGALTAAERDDLALFLLNVPYPPAQRRSYTNELSTAAVSGFRLFHIDGDLQGDPQPNVCGNCHRMPFWVSTNTPGTGMEAPTWRGAYDRWLILPQGRLNIIDFDFYRRLTDLGTPERSVWRLSWAGRTRFDPVWNMVLEGSTGFGGAYARQVTLNPATASDPSVNLLLDALERSAAEGGIVLEGQGALIDGAAATPLELEFDGGAYREAGGASYTRAQLASLAESGAFVGTLTGRLGAKVGLDHPQPALWTLGPIERQRGPQQFPTLSADNRTLLISGRHLRTGAHVIVDGRRVAGNVRCQSGTLPDCSAEAVEVQLAALPASAGMHFLQLQNPAGLFSNDFIFHTETAGSGVPSFDVSGPWFNPGQDGHGWFLEQIASGDPGQPDRLNAYWYVYRDGEPVWLIGLGDLVDGIAELDAFITSGADFPPDFDPAAVDLTPWGSLSFEFADDRTGNVRWDSIVDGFGSGSLNIEPLGAIADSPAACQSGSYYDPEQDGHGFVAQILEINGETQVLLSWYVYFDGRQVWLLGQAPLVDGRAEVPMTAFAGADFPPDFTSADVVSTPWGTVSLQFTGPDRARADWTPTVEGYAAGGIDLERLTHLVGHHCDD